DRHQPLDVLCDLGVDVVLDQLLQLVSDTSLLLGSGVDQLGQDLGVQNLRPHVLQPETEVPVEHLEVEHPVVEHQPLDIQQGTAGLLLEATAVLYRNNPRLVGRAKLDQPGPETGRVHEQAGRLRVTRQRTEVGADEVPERTKVVLGLYPVDRHLLALDPVLHLTHSSTSGFCQAADAAFLIFCIGLLAKYSFSQSQVRSATGRASYPATRRALQWWQIRPRTHR